MINEKYSIKKKLGEGRSQVYLCEDADFPGKDLAIKILPKKVSLEELETFRNEYFILRKLNHPNIIKTFDFGTIVRKDSPDKEIESGSRFITLECFEGTDLFSYNFESEDELKNVIAQLCSVLYYLHQSNFIYYDLKPENILIAASNNILQIKLIDLGLARYVHDTSEFSARGTAEYIAPEILKNEIHDHRVDLYSLGMLVYRIIYKKFPFTNDNQLDIYKSHVKGDFEFSETSFSNQLIDVVKKLLATQKEKRYFSTLQVLSDLNIPVDEFKRDWIPAKTFTNRKDALAVIHSFINKQTDGEVLTIRGTEGAGKTSLFEEVYSKYEKTILIRNSRYSGNAGFWKVLLREIVFSEFIYPNLSSDLIKNIFLLFEEESTDLIDSLKAVLIRIAKDNKFILLLDEYNRYDEFSLEIMRQLIPVFQINNIRLILSEDSSHSYLSETISNLTVVNLSPFTESQLTEHIDRSFAPFFPKEEAKKIIMMYADLLPGSIDSFLKDIVILNILEFTPDGPLIEGKEDKLKLLKTSQDEIYKLRLNELTEKEYDAAKFLSLFESSLTDEILSEILNENAADTNSLLDSLKEKNILSPTNISINPEFTSDGLQKYIYSNIEEKNKYHLIAAEVIEKNYSSFNRIELARQFEFSGLFYRSYEILKEELKAAERLSALSYKKKLLLHVLDFPLVDKDLNDINFDLAVTLFRIGDKKSSLDIIEKLLLTKLSKDKELDLLVLKGNCLLSTGEPANGIEILKKALPSIKQDSRKQEILFDIASAEFDLNNYSSAGEISKGIIRNVNAGGETRGKAHNLLGLIQIYEKGNIDGAIDHFEDALEVYEKAGLLLNVSGMEVNLGNIFNMKGDWQKAELHWNKSMQINLSIGNLEQEAKLLLNYGIYYFDKLDFETAIERYTRAHHILSSLGNKAGEGLVLINLGEVNLAVCDYYNSFLSLKKARKIFKSLSNYEEEAEVIFMLGKYYFILGSIEGLNETLADYKKLLDKKLLIEKHKINFEFLEQLKNYSEGKFSEQIDKLQTLRDAFLNSDDKNNFVMANFIICDIFIKLEKYKNALQQLNNDHFIAACEQNDLLKAERKYYLGGIAEKDSQLNLNSPIEYYEEAYTLVKNLSITELTWNILYACAEFYQSRGNTARASEYMKYTRSIIEFIAENIKDNIHRRFYLSKPERKAVLENLSLAEVNIK